VPHVTPAFTRRYEIAAENKRLSEPLAKALKEVEVLRGALACADKDKASLAQAKERLAAAVKQVGAGWLWVANGRGKGHRRARQCLLFGWQAPADVTVCVCVCVCVCACVAVWLQRLRCCWQAVQVKNLEWEAEVLAQRFAAVQAERDSLYDKFEASVFDVAQKTGAAATTLAGKGVAHIAACGVVQIASVCCSARCRAFTTCHVCVCPLLHRPQVYAS
jgi:hypothetical protein